MLLCDLNGGFEASSFLYGYSIDRTDKNTPLIYVTTCHKFFTHKVFVLLFNVNVARDRRVDCTIKIRLWHTMFLEQPCHEFKSSLNIFPTMFMYSAVLLTTNCHRWVTGRCNNFGMNLPNFKTRSLTFYSVLRDSYDSW